MESMEDRIAALEAQLLAHRMLLSIIAADATPALRKQLAAACTAAATRGLYTMLSDHTLAELQQELQQCVQPSGPESPSSTDQ
jgi:uncharacterized membrane protein